MFVMREDRRTPHTFVLDLLSPPYLCHKGEGLKSCNARWLLPVNPGNGQEIVGLEACAADQGAVDILDR